MMKEGWRRRHNKIISPSPLLPPPASGSLHAKLEVQEGPSVPKPTVVQFVCEGATLSGVGLELVGSGGYRISLLKLKSISGESHDVTFDFEY